MFRKIKAPRSSTEKEILDICQRELGCDRCRIEPGPTMEVIYKTSPPANTIAVLVDISSAGGAIKIGEASDNALGVGAVGMVGTEDAGDLVIVPWNVGWWYYSIGSIGIKYIVKA
ncbi:hypothetical protein VTN96DRAFT_7089 [Rasamsonia emersonii]